MKYTCTGIDISVWKGIYKGSKFQNLKVFIFHPILMHFRFAK